MLSWFGSRDLGNLAWVSLDHDEGSILESLGLSWLDQRGTGIGVGEFFNYLVSHFIFFIIEIIKFGELNTLKYILKTHYYPIKIN